MVQNRLVLIIHFLRAQNEKILVYGAGAALFYLEPEPTQVFQAGFNVFGSTTLISTEGQQSLCDFFLPVSNSSLLYLQYNNSNNSCSVVEP